MFDFHKDKSRYFQIQEDVTTEDIIPFIEQSIGSVSGKHVLEIGCAEAGVLNAFLKQGCTGVGVELSVHRYEIAQKMLSEFIEGGKADIINKNIYNIQDPKTEFGRLFDIIILKDVIEHIPDQEKFIPFLRNFLNTDGVIFFAYPPWWMPFGGHQQLCDNKLLRTFPWFHLLPMTLYKSVLRLAGEQPAKINDLVEIKETGINIDRMYHILRGHHFQILSEVYWWINPIYKFKFGLKKRQVSRFLTRIPYLRNFYTTAHYILFR